MTVALRVAVCAVLTLVLALIASLGVNTWAELVMLGTLRPTT